MDIKDYMTRIGKQAREAAAVMAKADTATKNRALIYIAEAIRRETSALREANQKDLLKDLSVEDMLASFVEHIALQIALGVSHLPKGKILVTGGGARNQFLMERLQARSSHEVVIPDNMTIDYKEALVFAFLGLLRMENKTNVLSSVTGAESDSCSGKIWKND